MQNQGLGAECRRSIGVEQYSYVAAAQFVRGCCCGGTHERQMHAAVAHQHIFALTGRAATISAMQHLA